MTIKLLRQKLLSSKQTYLSVHARHSPPSPLGNLIATHEHDSKFLHHKHICSLGNNIHTPSPMWHGSSLDLWSLQIQRGCVEEGEDLYLANVHTAASYALSHDNPILLRMTIIAGKCQINKDLQTFYMDGSHPRVIVIDQVYRLNQEFINYMKDPSRPSRIYINTLAAKEGLKAFWK